MRLPISPPPHEVNLSSIAKQWTVGSGQWARGSGGGWGGESGGHRVGGVGGLEQVLRVSPRLRGDSKLAG